MKTKSWLQNILKAILFLLVLSYPLAVYFGLRYFSISTVGCLFGAVMALRMVSSNYRDAMGLAFLLGALVGVGLNFSAAFFHSPLLMKLHPVAMSGIFLLVFLSSLYSGDTVIARFARRFRGPLNPQALVYTTKVTWLWTGFFLANGTVAAYTTFFGTDELWALYNGFVSYVLMGLLFTGEFIYRRMVVLKADS